MRWILALMAALGLGLEARAQTSPTLTFDTLFALSPQEAAARVFGPTPEVFVERAPWNNQTPNLIGADPTKFQMELFATPERIAPSVCAVTKAWAIFDMGWPAGGSAEEKSAWNKLPYAQRPLSLDKWDRQREYFAAGPAPATPAVPGGKPVTPTKSALAKDSCGNPVALRGRFVAPSDEAAILLVSQVNAAAAAARRSGPLPFKVHASCNAHHAPCRPRQGLANLKLGWLSSYELDEGCRTWRSTGLPRGARRCLWFDLDDPSDTKTFSGFIFVLGSAGKLLDVVMVGKPNIVP